MADVVFVIGKYMNGGVARRATVLGNYLAGMGHKVTLLATGGIGKDVYFEVRPGVELLSLDDYVKEYREDEKCRKVLAGDARKIRLGKMACWLPGLGKRLGSYVRKIKRGQKIRLFLQGRPASVLIGFGIAYYELALAGRRSCDKLVFAERNASQLEVPPEMLHEAGRELEAAEASIFQTEDERQYYKDFKLKNACVIRNPVSGTLPSPFSGDRRKCIVNFCRISKQKNLEMLVDAFAKLHAEFPDYTVEIYGNTVGENEEALKVELLEYIRQRGLEEAFKLLPPRGDVHEVCQDAAMFVSTSYFEGLSNSMIEAMAIGLPCVCTDCLGGGAREVIVDGVNGLLVPNEDVEACYKAMKRFMQEPELAAECSRNAAKISCELSVEAVGEAWHKVIEGLWG